MTSTKTKKKHIKIVHRQSAYRTVVLRICRVIEAREAILMKQLTLAKKIKMPPPMLSDIERGRRNPTRKEAKLIAHILGTPMTKLFPEEEYPYLYREAKE